MPEYWQVAAGDGDRKFHKFFIKHGIAFVGGDTYVARIREIAPGDRLLLKKGTGTLVAVGEAVQRDGRLTGVVRDSDNERQWLRDFDGWDLPAWCHVRWHVPEAPIAVSLSRGTLSRCYQSEARERAEAILAQTPPEVVNPEPRPVRPISDEELVSHLVNQGLRAGAAEQVTAELKRIRLLAGYYLNEVERWDLIKEHETRTFLVIPLLLALGWAEQQIKIEYSSSGGSVDVACFRRPFRKPEDDECTLIFETKGLAQGLGSNVYEQVLGYAKNFRSCGVMLVTNGYCYKAYRRTREGAFAAQPSAYLNIRRPTDRYPLNPDRVAGALEAIELLLPNVALRNPEEADVAPGS